MTDNSAAPTKNNVTLHDLEVLSISALFFGFDNQTLAGVEDVNSLHMKGLQKEGPEFRVRSLLQDVLSMYLTPENSKKPYGPRMVLADGRRTADIEDFDARHIEIFTELAVHITNPNIRARLLDVAWFCNRSLHEAGAQAVGAYLEVADNSDDDFQAFNSIARALSILRGLKWPDPVADNAKNIARNLYENIVASEHVGLFYKFSELAYKFSLYEHSKLAEIIEEYASKQNSGEPAQTWKMAARSYRKANDKGNEFRCIGNAAECYVRQAEIFETEPGNAMQAAHWLTSALQTYHGYSQARDRRVEIRHKLVEIQERIPDEMSSHSHEIDMSDITKSVKERFEELSLKDALFELAIFGSPPRVEKVELEARESLKNGFFRHLFVSTNIDNKGKTVSKIPAIGDSQSDYDKVLEAEISKSRSLDRSLCVYSQISVAFGSIGDRFYVSSTDLKNLLRHSPFVPPDHIGTFVIGFEKMFRSDWTSASYILVPLVEGILRHMLKMNGHDVSTFDDATGIQQDRTITSMFDSMRSELDEIFTPDVTYEIDRLLLSKTGPHLRHQLAHALGGDYTPRSDDAIFSCVFIFWLCCYPLFKHKNDIQIEEN